MKVTRIFDFGYGLNWDRNFYNYMWYVTHTEVSTPEISWTLTLL